MIRIRRTFTRTETVERLLVISGRTGNAQHCASCPPGTGWLTVEAAAEITGRPTESLLDLISTGEVHSENDPEGVAPLICAISLSLKVLKGEKENET